MTPTGPRIVLVEDNEELREIIAFELRERGYAVAEAGDGDAALALLAPGAFDVLMTDVVLGQSSGLVLARTARELAPRAAVIVASDPGFEKAALELDQVKFLAKPFGMATLLGAVEEALAAARARGT
jgi:two-component system response regulator HydG